METISLKKSNKPREVLINGDLYKVRGNVFEYKPCVKLWIGFKPEHYKPQGKQLEKGNFKTSKTIYMPDLRNSITQVMFRNTPPIVDWQAATNRAIHLVNDTYHDKFNTAIISFESRYTKTKKELILYYYQNGRLIDNKSNPVDFLTPEWIKYKEKCEGFIAEYIEHSEIVVDFQNAQEVHRRTNMYL